MLYTLTLGIDTLKIVFEAYDMYHCQLCKGPMNNSLFGTDGIRSLVGKGCFTDTHLATVAHAIAAWVSHKYGPNATILIGHDTRNSCSWIKHTLIATLNRHRHKTYDGDVLPTPVICWLTAQNKIFNCGIIISASHNAWNYNGIKIFDATSGKLESADEEYITNLFYNPAIPPLDAHNLVSNQSYTQGAVLYKKNITALFKANFLKKMTIVVDCAHGALSVLAPQVFASFGATVITLNNQPNGININEQSGALHPEKLQQAVIAHNATVGFAFDGDGDRIIAVNQHGIIKDGDDILALLTTHPRYSLTKTVVGTTMANYGLEHFLHNHKKNLIRTDVGDKYVSQKLKENNSFLGGEQSGHIIITDFLHTGDGLYTALRIIETMFLTNNMLFETFEKWPQSLINVPITLKKDINSDEMQKPLKHYQSILNKGRILVRYSGTEPLLRVMVEGINKETAFAVCSELSQSYHALLNS